MKKIALFASVVLMVTAFYAACIEEKQPTEKHEDTLVQCDQVDTLDVESYQAEMEKIAWSIAMVESRCHYDAKNGQCIGYLQITPIMVKEANRLLGVDLYMLDDRWTITGSIAIFGTIMLEYNPELDLKKACEIWNPRAGERYYERVLSYYDTNIIKRP